MDTLNFYLATQEQVDAGGPRWRKQDPVYFGEVPLENGAGTAQFVVADHFETAKGNTLTISPGEFYLVAWQSTGRASSGSNHLFRIR